MRLDTSNDQGDFKGYAIGFLIDVAPGLWLQGECVRVLETIRPQLGSLIEDVIRITHSGAAKVPIVSERVWRVAWDDGKRRPTLERENRKDYDKFLMSDPSRFEDLGSLKTLQQEIATDPILRRAFLVADGDSGQNTYVSHQILLPAVDKILQGIDSGQSRQAVTDSVLRRVDEYLSSNKCKCRVIAPLINFTTTMTSIEIHDGIFLREFTDDDLQDHFSASTLLGDYNYLEKLSSSGYHLEISFERERKIGFDSTASSQSQRQLEDTLTSLRLLQAGAVGFGFMKYEQDSLFGKTASWTMGYDRNRFIHGDQYDFREDQLEGLRDILRNLKHVRQESRFAIALNRLMQAYPKPFNGDRLVDCWIALESLMVPDGTGELTYRVSLRTARLVADAAERQRAYKFLRASYGQRSEFVHGSKPTVDEKTVRTTEDYLRRVLLHCVRNQKVPTGHDLDSLVLGQEADVSD